MLKKGVNGTNKQGGKLGSRVKPNMNKICLNDLSSDKYDFDRTKGVL